MERCKDYYIRIKDEGILNGQEDKKIIRSDDRGSIRVANEWTERIKHKNKTWSRKGVVPG